MSRAICNYDLQLLCVNNYRGEDYNKPDSIVECEDCVFNPNNKEFKSNKKDSDKVIKELKKGEEDD